MTQSIQCERTCTNAETNHLTENEYHELLMAEPRRMALDILTNTTTPVDLKDLSAMIAARENDVEVADEETAERVACHLHHSHLPKMADLGVIDYNPDAPALSRVSDAVIPNGWGFIGPSVLDTLFPVSSTGLGPPPPR